MDIELKFLVVEDDPVDAYSVRRILAKTGLGKHVDGATSLKQAKQKIRLTRYDAVILDLGLPDSQGIDGIIDFQATAPELPIIVLSGNQDEKTALKSIDIGAEDFIDKGSVTEDSLRRSIRFAIERHRRKQQVFRDNDSLRVSLDDANQKAASLSAAPEAEGFSAEQLILCARSVRPFTPDGSLGNHLGFGLGPEIRPLAAPAISRARAAMRLGELTLHGLRQAQAWRAQVAPGSQLHLDIEADAIKPEICTEMNRIFASEGERTSCILFFHTDFSSQPGAVSGADLRLLRQSGFQIGARSIGDGASILENLQLLAPQWIRFDPALTINVSRYKKKSDSLKQFMEMLRPLGAKWVADETDLEEDLRVLLDYGFAAYTSNASLGSAEALHQGVQEAGHAFSPQAKQP